MNDNESERWFEQRSIALAQENAVLRANLATIRTLAEAVMFDSDALEARDAILSVVFSYPGMRNLPET